MYYIKYFFITSILGFFLEEIVCKNYESGILYGPFTPIYGVGSIIIILLSNKILKKRHIKPLKKIILVFTYCLLILSLTELVGGLAIEKIFKISFWDYTNKKYHIGKYICLETAIIWGIASVVFICTLKPILDGIVKKIPSFLVYIISILFVLDVTLTLITKTKTRSINYEKKNYNYGIINYTYIRNNFNIYYNSDKTKAYIY